MDGALQTVQFFGANLLACYMFFLMLGTIGFFSSLQFVRSVNHLSSHPRIFAFARFIMLATTTGRFNMREEPRATVTAAFTS